MRRKNKDRLKKDWAAVPPILDYVTNLPPIYKSEDKSQGGSPNLKVFTDSIAVQEWEGT
jgi:hypothetical protein